MKKFFLILFIVTLFFNFACSKSNKKASGTHSGKIIHLNDDNFESTIKDGVVLIDFWAEWCKPCKMIAPTVEELSKEMPNVKFTKVNVDENRRIAAQFRIRNIPTLYILVNGSIFDGIVGVQPKETIKEKLNKALESYKISQDLMSGKVKFTDVYDFTLPDINGNPVTLSKIDGMIVLDFWATWCGPCKREIPYLQKLYDKYKDKGLTVIGVTSESLQKLIDFQKEMQNKGTAMDYILLRDEKREMGKKLGISSIPTTYFIAPDGRLIKKETGFAPSFAEEFEKIIKENLLR
jgi:thioredoxin 1